VLGILHSKWKHIPERFKDFIGLPKANGYRSLHTTILDRDRPDRGRPAEIQIRAFQMHEVAEYGIAAHWSYKEGVPSTAEGQSIFTWLRQMLEDIRELKNPYQFIQSMKWELFPDEVYVFTPKGDLFALPAGSTPIDFAYKVHSDVGQTCCGVEVNGMIVPLRYRLQNGDRVKILTNSRAHPSRDWLRWVKTARARERIRRWFRERNRGQAIELGRTFLKIEMRRQHLESTTYLKSPELLAVAEKLKMRTIDDLLMQIGNGTESAEHVVTLLHPEPHTTEGQGATSDTPPPSPAIQLEGIDIALVRIMKCCNPIPGDEIIGYITRGRGVSIHRTNCPRIINETERIVNVEWKAADQVTYPAEIAVQCDDRPGMLGEIATIISQYKVNIVEGSLARPEVLSEGMAQDRLTLAVNGTEQLEAIMESIRCLKGVRSVRRVSLEN
jgi:GTP pyrophosphokinase